MKKWKKIVAGLVIFLIVLFTVLVPWFKRHAQSVTCGNYMSSYCLVATLWADDREGYFPTNLTFLADPEIGGSPKWLICPSDNSRKAALSWPSFTSTNSSYEIVTFHLRSAETNSVFLRCKIHGHLGYPYGFVFDGVERRTKKNW